MTGGHACICVMNVDGTDVLQLTAGYFDINVSWHPNGNALLFNRLKAANSDDAAIMTLALDDRAAVMVSNRVSGWFASARWNPDGSAIAIATNAFGPPMEVALMDPLSGSLTRVTCTADGVSGGHMDWSPDGERILFSAFRSGQADTYVIDATGENETRLTNDAERIQSGASWSPKGTNVVFHSTPMGEFDEVIMESELFVMDADGRNIRQLTSSPHSNAHPDW